MMNKNEIISSLYEKHQSLVNYVLVLNEEEFIQAKKNKWSAGQQVEHIFMSIRPLNQAFMLPGFALKLIFGKVNRPSKSYEELVSKYKSKLSKGGVAPSGFTPKRIDFTERNKLTTKLIATFETLVKRTKTFSENDLDKLILPHPLLGKVTIREMLYFTIYHAEHHQLIITKNLAE